MKIQCPRCGYEWNRRSKLLRLQCPNCNKQWSLPLRKWKSD